MKIEFEIKDFPGGSVAEPWLIPVDRRWHRFIVWLLKKIGAKTGIITSLTPDDYELPKDFGKFT